MSRSKPLSVYVIGSEDGPQKIGVSDSLAQRVVCLQSERPERIRLIVSHDRPNGDARLVERAAHQLLANRRAKGEWFNATPDEAMAAIDAAIGMVDAGEVEMPRPRAPQENVMGVRFTEEEQEALRAAADHAGLPMARLGQAIIRDRLLDEGVLSKRRIADEVGVSRTRLYTHAAQRRKEKQV